MNGRLDQQRYRYTLWRPNLLTGCKMDAEEAATELARRYFHWIGPATVKEWQTFSGFSAKMAKAALEPLHLDPLGQDDPHLLLSEDREQLERFRVLPEP